MSYFLDHSHDLGRSFNLNHLVHFPETECPDSPFLVFRPVDDALNLCNFNFSHDAYSPPLKTFFKLVPLVLAIVNASLMLSNASMVAFTTLCGFDDSLDFASTSVIPALSSTARIAPPAITPVPCEAGFRNTLPPPYLPSCSCGTVPFSTGTFTRFFFASSIPLVME